MDSNFSELRQAYQRAFWLSVYVVIKFLYFLRTHRYEKLVIRLCNAFLLLLPISLWIRLLLNKEWLLLFPLTVVLLSVFLVFLLGRKIPNKIWTTEQLQSYEASPAWQLRKKLTIERDKYCCKTCGSTENLRIERINEQNIGNENLHELTTICQDCYLLPNKRLKFIRKTNPPTFIL